MVEVVRDSNDCGSSGCGGGVSNLNAVCFVLM